MGDSVKDKNIEIDGKAVGGESLIRLNVKTAIWIIGAVFTAVMTILGWSYFDLKKEVAAFKAEDEKAQKEFIENVDIKVDDMTGEIQTIRIDQATIKGDIKLILDRQTRDNPIIANPNRAVESTIPPGE